MLAPRHRRRIFALATTIAFILMALWSQATPLMSVSDEPAHTVRAAATVRGEIVGEEGAGADTGRIEFQVPEGIADSYDLTCTAWQPVSAACQPDVDDATAPLVAGETSAQTNLPTYYAIVGLPSLVVGGETAMHLMRLVNALLCALLVGAAITQLATLQRRRFAIAGFAIGALPTAVYLSGTINPNSVEWAGCAALAASLLALGRTPSDRALLVERLVTIAAAAALVVSARGVTPLFVACVVIAALLVADRDRLRAVLRSKVTWIVGGVTVLYMAASAWWILRPPTYDAEGLPSTGVGEPPLVGALLSFGRTLQHWDQLVNWYGWQDTQGPDANGFLLPALVAALVVAALAVSRGRMLLGVVFSLVAFLAIPIALSAALMPSVGYIWLGRYMLAPLMLLVLVAGVAIDDAVSDGRAARRLGIAAIAVAAVAQVLAAIWVLRRFAVGFEGSWLLFLRAPEWQPPLLVIPTVLLMTATIVVAALLLARLQRPRPHATVPAADPHDATAGQVRPRADARTASSDEAEAGVESEARVDARGRS